MKRLQLLSLVSILVFAFSFQSCKKQEGVGTTPPEQAHFTNKTSGSYKIITAGDVFKIPIGLTTVSSSQRTVTISVTSPSGAVEGTDFTLNKKSFTFNANQVIDSLVVTGNQSSYLLGEMDTLIFTISSPGVATSDYNMMYTLYVSGPPPPCNNLTSTFNLSTLVGNYVNTIESYNAGTPYGPYTARVSSAVQTGPTTGTIKIYNLWDAGGTSTWNDITFNLDWTDRTNQTCNVVEQSSGIGDAGTLSATYAGSQVAVRPFAGREGTFEYCNQKINLKFQLGFAGATSGWFTGLYAVTLER